MLKFRQIRLSYFLVPLVLCTLAVIAENAKSSEDDEEDEEEEEPARHKHDEVGLQQADEEPQPQSPAAADHHEKAPLSQDKKAPHTFVEKIQAALDSKNSKIMHSYMKELMRLRINLDKIKDDLTDVTYDDAEEIKGLKEFLEYLDFAINNGLECIQAALNEDRKNAAETAGVSEAPRIQFTVQPIDKKVVVQMMDSVRNLKTCLRDQKKRCKRLYAEAKEAIVVAQERLTEAIEAYTDLLQHIEGKPYVVKEDAKPEEDDEEDDASAQ